MAILTYTTNCISFMVLHVAPLTLITARPACGPIYFMLALPCPALGCGSCLVATHCLLKPAWPGTLLVVALGHVLGIALSAY